MTCECFCGSGLPRRPLYDARGIFCCNVCDRCEAERRSGFRPEMIFTDAAYPTEEAVDDQE